MHLLNGKQAVWRGGLPLNGSAEILPNSWANIRSLNAATVDAFSITLSDDITAWGDSLTAGTASGPTGSASWVPELGSYFTNTINNEGVGGETSTEILTRLNASAAGQKDDYSVVMWGTNNGSGGSYEATTINADFASANTALTGSKIFVGGFQTLPYGVFEANGVSSKDVLQNLKDTYPSNYLSLWAAMCRQIVDDPTAEDDLISGNFKPLQIDATNLHWSDATGLEKDVARMIAAQDGSGPPMVLEEETPVRYVSGSTAGTVIHQFRRAGTPTAWEVVAGNDDGAFNINASGQLLTTATAFTDDFRDVFVKASNANGDHYARVIVGLSAADDDYSQAARCSVKTGHIFYHGDSAPREFSIAILTKYNSNGRLWESGACNLRSNSNGSYTMLLRDTSGATVNSTAVSPGAGWHWVFGSARIDAAVATNGLVTYGYDSTPSTKVPATTDPLDLDVFSALLTNNQTFSLASDHDIRALWIAHEFVDWSNSAVRDALFNSGTLAPVVTGDGTISGVTPQVWMYGGPGDWASGNNRGTANVHPIPTIDAARAQYVSAAA